MQPYSRLLNGLSSSCFSESHFKALALRVSSCSVLLSHVSALLLSSFFSSLSLQGKSLKLKWQAGPNAGTATFTSSSSSFSSCVNQHLVALEGATLAGQFAKAGTRSKRTHTRTQMFVLTEPVHQLKTCSLARSLLPHQASLSSRTYQRLASQLRGGKIKHFMHMKQRL